MIKRLLTLVAVLGCLVLNAENNLLPPLEQQKGPGPHWETARNADAAAEFGLDQFDGKPALKIIINSNSGYAFYRFSTHLKPGEYTVRTQCRGRTAAGIGWEVYSFDRQDKARLIRMNKTPGGAIDQMLQGTFTVPADSVKIRFGLGLSGQGTAIFIDPILIPGKAAPLPAAAKIVKTPQHPILNRWLADWLWLKNDSGVPRVIFTKNFELKELPTAALLQLTADNGYTVLVNDQVVGSDVDWQTVEKYDIAPFLKTGANQITLDVMNYDGPGGVIMQGFLMDRQGAIVPLKTDATWQISVPSGQPAELLIIGPPPAEPWRVLPMNRIVPPLPLNLSLAAAPSPIVAGEVLKWEFTGVQSDIQKELPELAVEFLAADGSRLPLSAYAPITRYQASRKSLLIEIPTSRFAVPGTYRAQITTLAHTIPVTAPVTILPPAAPLPRGGMHWPKKQTNVMSTPQGLQSLFTYSTDTPKLQSFLNWTHTGGHMYEVSIPSGHWKNTGKYDTAAAEKIMLQILEADPQAGIYLKIRVDIPGWWAGRYPNDIFRSNKGRYALQSFASENWRREAIAAVAATVKELGSHPVGNALSGVLLMGFRGGEFQLWGEDVGEYDCSPVAVQAFQKAHPEIKLPHPALEWPFQDQSPEYRKVRTAYFQFLAERHADNIIYFAREFKQIFGDKYSFGVYFGYGMEHSSSLKRMLYSGHLGIAKVLQQAPLDVLSCPFSYSLRRADQSHAYMNPAQSALLRGIQSLPENDIRNYAIAYDADSSGPTVTSLTDSILTNRRMRLLAASNGTAIRYLALISGSDFFAGPEMLRSIAADNQLVMQLAPTPIGTPEQIALAADQLSWCRAGELDQALVKNFCSSIRDTLLRTGRNTAQIIMEDLLTTPKRWQYAVIPLPGLLDRATLQKLSTQYGPLPELKSDSGALVITPNGKTVVNSLDEIRDLLATSEAKQAGPKTVWYIGADFKATWDGKQLKIMK